MRVTCVFTTVSPSGRYANVHCLPGGRQANAINTSGSVQAHIAFRISTRNKIERIQGILTLRCLRFSQRYSGRRVDWLIEESLTG